MESNQKIKDQLTNFVNKYENLISIKTKKNL